MAMKQQCALWNVWLTWLTLSALTLAVGMLQSWWAAGFIFAVGVLAQFLYVRFFSWMSRLLGYGSVDDVQAGPLRPVEPPGLKVTLYTANVCPFCLIVRRRLLDLREGLGFEFAEVDVTFRPQVVLAKGVRSLPLVEANGRVMVGNAASEQLAAFVKAAAESRLISG